MADGRTALVTGGAGFIGSHLAEALTAEAIGVYGKQATGEKILINPNKDL